MHQVIIHIVSPQAGQLLVEISVYGTLAGYQILRKLRGNIDLIPDAVLLDYPA